MATATPHQLATLVQEQQTAEAAALEQQTVEEADGGEHGDRGGVADFP